MITVSHYTRGSSYSYYCYTTLLQYDPNGIRPCPYSHGVCCWTDLRALSLYTNIILLSILWWLDDSVCVCVWKNICIAQGLPSLEEVTPNTICMILLYFRILHSGSYTIFIPVILIPSKVGTMTIITERKKTHDEINRILLLYFSKNKVIKLIILYLLLKHNFYWINYICIKYQLSIYRIDYDLSNKQTIFCYYSEHIKNS